MSNSEPIGREDTMKLKPGHYVFLFLVVMAIIGFIITPKEVWEKQAAQREANRRAAEESGKHITQENFQKITVGMTFDAVESILGKDWKEVSAAGSMQTYVWKGGIFRSITITLDNNLVFSKSSMGLK